MADTVKKSRIVSQTDENLEESLLEEFNLRLKKCLSRDNLHCEDATGDSHIYENVEIIKTNGTSPVIHGDAVNLNSSQIFLEKEREHCNLNSSNVNVHSDSYKITLNCESTKTEINLDQSADEEEKPSLNLPTSCLTDDSEMKSVKNRMFLSSDDASCLLFTQTVTSPMLTPSEENIDFLKGFKRESLSDHTNSDSPKNESECNGQLISITEPTVQNIYENVDYVTSHTDQSIKEETLQFINIEKSHNTEESYMEGNCMTITDEPKNFVTVKQIDDFENEVTNVCSNIDVSTVTESHFVETTEVRSTGETNGLKKKKSKKSKNQHEKENISVSETNFIEEDSFYNVNVKNLCRSFGDLTKIDRDPYDNWKNIETLKSSFSKFDALQKKNILNSQPTDHDNTDACNCKKCGRPVFQMERVVAERCIWHRNCFRCIECGKQLLVDNFESHEGTLYCKPHFKALFQPKAVEDDSPSSDKPDLGLEELHSLNVKERFQVFENVKENHESQLEKNLVKMERSPSILSKLARFQAKGMNVGVSDDYLNGVPIEGSSSEEEADQVEGEDAELIRAKRVQKEKPFHFLQMSDVKSKWEQGNQHKRDDLREERKQEIQNIRSRLFLGKQGKMKEAYQQAIVESESGASLKKEVPIEAADTRSIKDRFERGDVATNEIKKETEDMSVFDSGISKKSRSIFLELDAGNTKAPKISPTSPVKLSNSVRNARESKTPEREVFVDPDIVKSDEFIEDSVIAKSTHTATKMLSKFRQMEENLLKGQEPQGPKPLKRFTPPREPRQRESSSECESGSEGDSVDEVDNTQIVEQDLIEAQKAARAQKLRAKFERWEQDEIKRENSVSVITEISEDQSQVETARSLCAKFESLRETNNVQKQSNRVKVNRFVGPVVSCKSCCNKVYPLEMIRVHGQTFHKRCFRCIECKSVLRMNSYSYNQGLLYCMTHFKRLFISKGNYESAFGLEQHKDKWNVTTAP